MNENSYFENREIQSWGPAVKAYAIAPSDSTDLPNVIRSVTIGTSGGSISFVSSIDGLVYTTGPLPVGNYPLWAKRIRATGTSAVGLTGWA